MPGAAAVAQKGESGGAVSKTSINKHQKKSILREKRMRSSCYYWYLKTDLFSHVLYTEYTVPCEIIHTPSFFFLHILGPIIHPAQCGARCDTSVVC